MSSSPDNGGRTPLSDRTREWVFKLLYAQRLTKRSPAWALRVGQEFFSVPDDEWDRLNNLSRYVENPRVGKAPESTWTRIGEDVGTALAAIEANRERIEQAIRRASPRWRLERMPVVDRLLLTIGGYELLIQEARPAKRVINRTVELAKIYGASETRRFINGVLDQIRKDAQKLNPST